jgi:hypothetical protein
MEMSNLPHFLTDPADPQGQPFRADCMAWELFTKKPRADREAFIASQPGLQTEDFRLRLFRCEAWWLITYCTPHQVEESIAHLSPDEMQVMRDHIKTMRLEMKAIRQRKFRTAHRGKSHA